MKRLLACLLGSLAVAWGHPAAAADHPNILWISSEDNGPQLGCYGDDYATTPNIDALAGKGMLYRNAWSTAPVCAPARTTIISGVYPIATGSQHMRSETRLPYYMQMFPRYLRDAGYYCTNNSKEDYNLVKTEGVWDESSPRAHWNKRADGQPFFAVFNITTSHESQVRRRPHEPVHDPAKVRVPAYHPDTPTVRRDWAQYYDKVTEMDATVGERLRELEAAGLAEDTIIFYWGDHGPGMPRGKRWTYNSGLHVPLIAYFPEKYAHLAPKEYAVGGESQRLTGFIDFAPTMLSLAGIQPPGWMQGHAFAGEFETEPPQHQFGFRDRMDERYDLVRSVRDERFVYIRNFMPHRIYGQFLNYMFQTPTTQEWHDLYHADELQPPQTFFWEEKPTEELYDLANDPDEVNNLANDPAHAERITTLRAALREWQLKVRDIGLLPEAEVHARTGDEGTPYDMGHDDYRYPMRDVLATAERASDQSFDDLALLAADLRHADSAVRYWAATGFLIRGGDAVAEHREALLAALGDPAPSVAIVAAEALGRHGSDGDATRAVNALGRYVSLEPNGLYVSLQALNAIDYLDEQAVAIREIVDDVTSDNDALIGKLREYRLRLREKILVDLDGEQP